MSAAIPFENPLNILLDDVEKEIDFLLNQQPTEEKRLAKMPLISSNVIMDFDRLLGSTDCNSQMPCQKFFSKSFADKKDPASRTVDLGVDDEHP